MTAEIAFEGSSKLKGQIFDSWIPFFQAQVLKSHSGKETRATEKETLPRSAAPTGNLLQQIFRTAFCPVGCWSLQQYIQWRCAQLKILPGST